MSRHARRTASALVLALACLGAVGTAGAQVVPPAAGANPNPVRRPVPPIISQTPIVIEVGTDRPGSDYRSFDLAQPNPQACADACAGESQCVAWTYVKPGVQTAGARCWLKTAAPTPMPSDCCTSSVMRPPEGLPIIDPKVEGYALDYCRIWAKECGAPAATAYCRSQGYRVAVDFSIRQSAPPTRVIGDGQVCSEPTCDAISRVVCN